MFLGLLFVICTMIFLLLNCAVSFIFVSVIALRLISLFYFFGATVSASLCPIKTIYICGHWGECSLGFNQLSFNNSLPLFSVYFIFICT